MWPFGAASAPDQRVTGKTQGHDRRPCKAQRRAAEDVAKRTLASFRAGAMSPAEAAPKEPR